MMKHRPGSAIEPGGPSAMMLRERCDPGIMGVMSTDAGQLKLARLYAYILRVPGQGHRDRQLRTGVRDKYMIPRPIRPEGPQHHLC